MIRSPAASLRRTAFSLLFAGTSVLAATLARAQSADDKAEAESLFDEAGKLLRAGDATAACPKLERSLRLDRGIGTLLFLAECYERVGRIASAWATFREAAAEAKAVGQSERERIATARAKKLGPLVPRLRVDVPEGALPPGATVSRDDRPLDPATFGAAIAVDPGPHVVAITAPDHVPVRLERALAVGEEAIILVAPLTRTAGPASAPPAASSPGVASAPVPVSSAPPRHVRLPTYVVGGAGVVLGGLGVVFGARAFDKWGDAQSLCDAQLRCPREGLTRIDEARTAATVSNVLASAAVVALSVSGYMLWRDLRPEIALHDRGLALRGHF